MEKAQITFLGTGNAIPTKLRNHTSILFGYKNENILIDCGEGTQRQFKYAKKNPNKMNKILLTHWHGDHVLGLPGLLQTLAMNDYSKKLQIYGPRGTKNNFSILSRLFNDFRINLDVKEISNEKIDSNEIIIESLEMKHGLPCNAYSIIIPDKLRIDKKKLKKLKIPNSSLIGDLQKGKDVMFNGKKITSKSVTYLEKGKKVTFILDTGINENAFQIAKNSDILIVESTFSSSEQERATEYLHLTAKDAATIAKKSKSKMLILTHISERYEQNLSLIEKEAKKIFKNTKVAKDLESFTIR